MCDQGHFSHFEVCCVSETLCSFLYKKEKRMHENGPQISTIFEKLPKGALIHKLDSFDEFYKNNPE